MKRHLNCQQNSAEKHFVQTEPNLRHTLFFTAGKIVGNYVNNRKYYSCNGP